MIYFPPISRRPPPRRRRRRLRAAAAAAKWPLPALFIDSSFFLLLYPISASTTDRIRVKSAQTTSSSSLPLVT